MEPKQAAFEGWAIVEIFGHQKAIGFVTTEAYGSACLFRVDTPELPEREYTLTRPSYTASLDDPASKNWTPAGAKVKRLASGASSQLLGPGSIYRLIPCTEALAREAIEDLIPRPLILLEPPPKSQPLQVTWPEEGPDDRCCEECGHTPEDGHSESCSFAMANEEDD
jgi:hypothetical protein